MRTRYRRTHCHFCRAACRRLWVQGGHGLLPTLAHPERHHLWQACALPPCWRISSPPPRCSSRRAGWAATAAPPPPALPVSFLHSLVVPRSAGMAPGTNHERRSPPPRALHRHAVRSSLPVMQGPGLFTQSNPADRKVLPDDAGDRTVFKVVYVVLESQYQSSLTAACKRINAGQVPPAQPCQSVGCVRRLTLHTLHLPSHLAMHAARRKTSPSSAPATFWRSFVMRRTSSSSRRMWARPTFSSVP